MVQSDPQPTRRQGDKTRVLILGGGFGGVAVAQTLAQQFRRDASVEITLVNRENYTVYLPLLCSAAAGSIEALHAVAPLRRLVHGVRVRAEEVVEINLADRVVRTVSNTSAREHLLPYDHLVLALGNIVNLSQLPGVVEHGKTIKTLGDAMAIRNHVLAMLEAADVETDPVARHEMLTFVVAGGGFSGVEMVGELNDMLQEAIRAYPSIGRGELRVVLLHSNARILPEMSQEIAAYALTELRKRGVEVQLNVRLAGATPTHALLQGADHLPTRTLIVAVGNAPPTVIQNLAVKKDRGRIVVDECMRVPDVPGLWALGDNALVPNQAAKDGTPSPPTAQYALRQGKTLGKNIAAAIAGRQPKPFAFGGLGLLCLIGHGAGVGELKFGIKTRGLLGWLLWRSVYWAKLPSFGRRVQVGTGWLLDAFLHREITQVNMERSHSVSQSHYEPGSYIFHQGDLANSFFMIGNGEVEVLRERVPGEEAVMARLGPGDYFGEAVVLGRDRRNASVRCLTAVDVFSIQREDFTRLAALWQQMGTSIREEGARRDAAPPVTTFIPSPLARVGAPPVGHLRRHDSHGAVDLSAEAVTLGSSGDNNVVVHDPAAADHHAVIKRQSGTYVVADLGTASGTWVNGARLAQPRELASGDHLRIGHTDFTFELPLAPEDPSAAATVETVGGSL